MIYTNKQLTGLQTAIAAAKHIMIMQPEHIDADSLGSSLGLESALVALDKKVTLYCFDTVPTYLRHVPGWDRVTSDFPSNYDLAILVDSSTLNQLEKTWSEHKNVLTRKPLICIDHHDSTTNRLEGDNIELLLDVAAGASGQQIAELAQKLDWHIDEEAAYALASAIKADTVNLATKKTSARTFMAMAYLVEQGADLELMRYNFEQSNALMPMQLPLKAEALSRTKFYKDDQIALTYFTQEEYLSLGDDHLVIERMKQELRMLKGVVISVIVTERKGYANASMRANLDVARVTAEHFGGGGHDRAASCRFNDADHQTVIRELIPVLGEYIDEAQAAIKTT